jgi:hypothetical protein
MSKVKAIVILVVLLTVILAINSYDTLENSTKDCREAKALLDEVIHVLNNGETYAWQLQWDMGDDVIFKNISFDIQGVEWLEGPYPTGGMVRVKGCKLALYRDVSTENDPAVWYYK